MKLKMTEVHFKPKTWAKLPQMGVGVILRWSLFLNYSLSFDETSQSRKFAMLQSKVMFLKAFFNLPDVIINLLADESTLACNREVYVTFAFPLLVHCIVK